ncbi:MAG: hypothetical protein ABR615_02365 [Pseudonocardiaceae bacterium]
MSVLALSGDPAASAEMRILRRGRTSYWEGTLDWPLPPDRAQSDDQRYPLKVLVIGTPRPLVRDVDSGLRLEE